MAVLHRTCLVRFLTAALLLVVVPGVSKVVCISATGHNAIEDWAALCCARGAGTPDTAFSEPTPCQGCTDYIVAPTIGIKSPQPDPSRAVSYDNSAVVMTEPAGPAQAASTRFTPALDRQLDPVNSQPQTTSLRC